MSELENHVRRLWGDFLAGHTGEFETWLDLFETEMKELAKSKGCTPMQAMEELEDQIGRSLSLSITFTIGQYDAVRNRLGLPAYQRPTTEDLEEYVREAVEKVVREDQEET